MIMAVYQLGCICLIGLTLVRTLRRWKRSIKMSDRDPLITISDNLDFVSIFSEYIAANQKEWAHDRAKSVGASEVFGCLRQMWFRKFGEKNGFAVDEDADEDWGAMQRGKILEAHFVVPPIRDH